MFPALIDEQSFIEPDNLERSLQKLAEKKADHIAGYQNDALVIGADTVVCSDSTILGKPASRDEAFAMLRQLSGKKHYVKTAVALVCRECAFSQSIVDTTEVYFREITDSEIHEYLAEDEYKDKAGAYAIQGQALVFIDKIFGCYYNVVGLPVAGTIKLFKEFVGRKEAADV
ncbi:MAG TPA: Maf family protein [Chitinispirillaceae bacterium]|nr:Maf family protein [Chitinispirillaceae bacterium]